MTANANYKIVSVQDISSNTLKTNAKQSTNKVPQTTTSTEKKSAADINCLSVVQLGSGSASESSAPKPEKILKPLGGFGNNNTEWIAMAEIITKVKKILNFLSVEKIQVFDFMQYHTKVNVCNF